MFEQALAINPEDAGALPGDAGTYLFDKVAGWASADVDYDAKILGQSDRSIAIAPNDPEPYSTKSLYLCTRPQHPMERGCEPPMPGSL